MKLIRLIATSCLLIMMIVTCTIIAQGGTKKYNIGDRGPGGGWVFYDKGNYSDGWRYLEAAGENIGKYTGWGCNGKSITDARGTAIGTGKSNTQAILKACEEQKCIARAVSEYRGGGMNDWFMPSKDELQAMFTNLRYPELDGAEDHGFSGEFYWTSSEIDERSVWSLRFNDGNPMSWSKAHDYSWATPCRPARSF